MNLYSDTSLTGLRQLVDTGKKSLPVHHIVVDHDGEVIIDPEMKFAGVGLNRFKFHTQISQSVKGNARSLKILLESLLLAFSDAPLHFVLHKKLRAVA